MTRTGDQPTLQNRVADVFAFGFVIVILIYAASGPASEFVRWFIETTTADFEELSRREQRLLYKSHWLGAAFRLAEQSVLLPTGMILGLPLAFGFVIVSLTLHKSEAINWAMAAKNGIQAVIRELMRACS